ncbi:MAG: glycosyltransferase family 1 protein [Synechococcales cyanobacterium CRU_2_2]|nr:glycosyltransferase family 1 protein [Synechococcales cyanobacterium CRU_2_2]
MLVNHLRANGVQVSVVAPHNHTQVNTFVPAEHNSPDLGKGSTVNSSRAAPDLLRIAGYPLPFNPELSIAFPVRLSALYARTFGAPPDILYVASPARSAFRTASPAPIWRGGP